MGREARISSERAGRCTGSFACMSNSPVQVCPFGRLLDTWSTTTWDRYSRPRIKPLFPLPDFAINAKDLDTRPMEAMKYRKLRRIAPVSVDATRSLRRSTAQGQEPCRSPWFTRNRRTWPVWPGRYHYSPICWSPDAPFASTLPTAGEWILRCAPRGHGGKCVSPGRPGMDERFTLEARLRSRDESGLHMGRPCLTRATPLFMQSFLCGMNRFSQ